MRVGVHTLKAQDVSIHNRIRVCVHKIEGKGGWVSIHENSRMCPYTIGLEIVCSYNRG